MDTSSLSNLNTRALKCKRTSSYPLAFFYSDSLSRSHGFMKNTDYENKRSPTFEMNTFPKSI